MECEKYSEVVEHESIVDFGDDVKIVSGHENIILPYMALNNSLDGSETGIDNTVEEKMKAVKTMVFLQEECKKEVTDGSNVINENDEGALGIKKKRGRKKKAMESSACVKDSSPKMVKVDKDGVKVTGRLLRSRTMAMSGSAKVDENKLNESVVGFKRKMEAECFDHSEFQKEVNESSQLARRAQKKQKRRGRPPKTNGEDGFKRKVIDECFDQNEIQKEVILRSQPLGRSQKKQKRRGRPPKMRSETGFKIKMKDECLDQIDLQKEANESNQLTDRQQKKTQVKKQKDMAVKKLKGRGRSPKVQEGNLSTNTKKLDNHLLEAKNVKAGPVIEHVQSRDQESDLAGDKQQKVNISEEGIDHTIVVEIVKGESTIQQDNVISRENRRKKQQSVRDQIVSMIMKASWTIEYRPRNKREYLDAVYVDQKGRTHWSITKAYFSLKKKIEKGEADDKEISAFSPIPVEEINVLFRSVSKIRSDKNKKKGKMGKNICKAEIVISGEAPSYKTLRKDIDSKIRKHIHKSAAKSANKSLKTKAKKDKFRLEHGVTAESAVQRLPEVSQKGRQSRKPCLVARSSSKGVHQYNDDYTMYSGKRNIISWMIDSGVIILGGKLMFGEGRRGNRLLEGQVTGDGIHCSCCNETMDISNFVSHGDGELNQTLKNIYYQSGSSLFTCLLESWRKEVGLSNIKFNYVDVKGDDPNDDTCNICGDGGDLICCDGCPSTFHQSCLDFQNFPSGDWHCIYCCCKFCGLVACDAVHHAPTSEMNKCCLCEEKFHHLCLQEENVVNVGSSNLSFCGRKCQETYIGVKFELKEGYSWTLLKCYDLSQYPDDPMKVQCNSKLAVAFSVMDECFVPIMDERSGVNTIHNVVYNCGSNFRRLDYSGFFTAILEKGGEIISAASIRIHGNRLAEMPFIGTRNMYRRQGMCRRLLDAIEAALSSLGVDELVIPAISDLYKTWTKVFGFKPFEESLRQAMKGMSLIMFPGTDMLCKPLLKNQFADKNIGSVAVSGDKAVECITVENDDNTLHSETKSSNSVDYKRALAEHLLSETSTASFQKSEIQCLPSDNEHKSVVIEVKMSHSTSTDVPKNSFDLNLQPAATETDIQSPDEEKVCENPFELPDSMVQVDNALSQPLVLV